MAKFPAWLKFSLSLLFILTACHSSKKPVHPPAIIDGPPLEEVDVTHIPNAIPRLEPLSRYGNPPSYTALGKRYSVMPKSQGYQAQGTASWYGKGFHGRRTSSGEPFDMFAMTAAHRSLPLPTYAIIKNLHNGKEIIVKINDRGPFVQDRLIDLSYAAAKKLAFHQNGIAKVKITAIDPLKWNNATFHTKINTQTIAKSNPVKKAPQKPPNPTVIAQANKKIYLQLGVFNEKSNAQKLADRAALLAALHSVDILPHQVSNKNLYKVRLGPLKSKADAQKIQQQLASLNPIKLIYE